MTDLIYRKDAIDALKSLEEPAPTAQHLSAIFDCEDVIKGIPSAQPERQRGAWIEYIPEHGKCPFCGNQVDLLGGKANNFCGECGADLRGEKE